MITANNAVIGLELLDSENSERETVISIHQLATSVKSILYSANVIALSSSHVLMASGTVFGEIIVWSCFLNGSAIRQANAVPSHHLFTGGSIFDVRISPKIASLNGEQPGRLLASCSDDRTVRSRTLRLQRKPPKIRPHTLQTDMTCEAQVLVLRRRRARCWPRIMRGSGIRSRGPHLRRAF